MTGREHLNAAEGLLDLAETEPEASALTAYYTAAAQVHATLAGAAATERLAAAVENLPTYEGMLSVYAFGVNGR